MKIFVIIAAFNEEKKIGKVIDDLKKEYTHIVVVDDGSSDRTSEIIESKTVIHLNHVMNRGQGAALKTGIDYAISAGADIIVTFDADGQFLASDIKKLIIPVEKHQADISLGSRFLGNAVNIPMLKKFVLRLGIFVVYFLYGIKITDSQSGLRVMSRAAAKKICIKSDRMEHAGEFFWEIMKNKLKYLEVPITVIYDEYSIGKGQSWTKSVELGLRMLFRRFFL
ncbi:MAG: glycosyltransferase family 2 protein [archaeon]